MIIVTFIIGCGFFLLSKGDSFNLRIKFFFIGYLPTIIFLALLLICFFRCNAKKSKDVITIFSAILTFLLFGYYVFAIFICAFEESKNPITDVRYYQDKVNGSLLKVFPKEIPDNALKVKFFYLSGFLQGGTEIVLYYVDENITTREFDKEYKYKAEWIGHVNDYNEKKGLLNDAFSNTPAQYKNEDDYTIYLIHSKCDTKSYCNHGDFLFVAFNEKTNEIIFKKEDW